MNESAIQARVLAALGSRPDLRLWRANVGVAVPVSQLCPHCRLNARPVRFGVPGQADLSGIIAPTGQRLEIEIKTSTGKQTEQQRRYQAMIESKGGIYIVARSIEDAERGVGG